MSNPEKQSENREEQNKKELENLCGKENLNKILESNKDIAVSFSKNFDGDIKSTTEKASKDIILNGLKENSLNDAEKEEMLGLQKEMMKNISKDIEGKKPEEQLEIAIKALQEVKDFLETAKGKKGKVNVQNQEQNDLEGQKQQEKNQDFKEKLLKFLEKIEERQKKEFERNKEAATKANKIGNEEKQKAFAEAEMSLKENYPY